MNAFFGGTDDDIRLLMEIKKSEIPVKTRLKSLRELMSSVRKKQKPDKDNIKSMFRKEFQYIYRIYIDALNSYNKPDLLEKLKSSSSFASDLVKELDDILENLLRLISCLRNKTLEFIKPEEIKDVTTNLFTSSVPFHYKLSGFKILMCYIQFLQANEKEIPSALLEAFTYAIPYDEMNMTEISNVAKLPILKITKKTKIWAQCLSKEKSRITLEELFSEYFVILCSKFASYSKIIGPTFAIMEKCWFPFFYPQLCKKYKKQTDPTLSFLPFQLDAEKIGYGKFCHPLALQLTVDIVIEVIGSSSSTFEWAKNLKTQEDYAIYFDAFSQVLEITMGSEDPLLKVKEEFYKELRKRTIALYFKFIEKIPEMLTFDQSWYYLDAKILLVLFQNFDTDLYFQADMDEKISGCSVKLILLIKDYDLKKDSKAIGDSCSATFRSICETIMELKTDKDPKPIINTLTQFLVCICITLASKSDTEIWNSIEKLFRNNYSDKRLFQNWQRILTTFTDRLVYELHNEENFELFSDPSLNPFKGLAFKKEYILQILYNAHIYKKEDSKYQKVFYSRIYNDKFFPWMKLLNVIDFPEDPDTIATMKEYCSTMNAIINTLVPFNKTTIDPGSKKSTAVSTFPPPNSTIFDIFGFYLFKYSRITNEALLDIRETALDTLCQLFCTNQSEAPFPLEHFSYFVDTLRLAFLSKEKSTISLLIQRTKRLFTLDYRGLTMLIPLYMNPIEAVLNLNNEYSDKVRNAAMNILGTIITISAHYNGYTFISALDGKEVTMIDIKHHAYNKINCVLSQYKISSSDTYLRRKIVMKAICCATVIIYQEALQPDHSSDHAEGFVRILMDKATDPFLPIEELALSCLCSIVHIFPILRKYIENFEEGIYSFLSSQIKALSEQNFDSDPDKKAYLSNYLNAVFELIMEDRNGILLNDRNIFMSILDSAEALSKSNCSDISDNSIILKEFMKEFYMNYPLRGENSAVLGTNFDELEFSYMKDFETKKFNKSANPVPNTLSSVGSMKSSDIDNNFLADIEEKKSIDDNSEGGNSGESESFDKKRMSDNVKELTKLKESDEIKMLTQKTVHLGYGGDTIITLIESPYLLSKIIVRDMTGKHAWLMNEYRAVDYNFPDKISNDDKSIVHQNAIDVNDNKDLKELLAAKKSVDDFIDREKEKYKKEVEETLKSPFVKSEGEIKEKKITSNDMRLDLLNLMCKNFPEIGKSVESIKAFTKVGLSKSIKDPPDFIKITKDVECTENCLSKLNAAENKLSSKITFKKDLIMINSSYRVEPSNYNHARSFLTHLGNLDRVHKPCTEKLVLLNEADPDFRVLVKFLDSECELRRSIKIGLIFVGRGQHDQYSILSNTKGSKQYDELLSGLGQIRQFKSLRNRPKIVYYGTATYEVVFHVATMMKAKAVDTQLVEKKKYIGNDSVHVVWTENDREYEPGTISGAFNFVHIIITPMRNKLCRIKIFKKHDKKMEEQNKQLVKFFGPIISGMMLPLNILPHLLRHTAINARKSVMYKNLQVFNPITERRRTLQKITTKFAMNPSSAEEDMDKIINRLIHCK